MKILLVEDNAKTRLMIRRILYRDLTGIEEVFECADGKEAVTLYRKNEPDWILMDINVKTLDGLQASKAILDLDPVAKIIIVTMYDEPEYQRLAEKVGVRDYVLKDDLSKITEIINLHGEKNEA